MPAYHPSLDGLRALCIAAVFVFHTRTGTLNAGFVGVEVFFTLSGYLITGVVCDQVERGGWWGPRFALRRAGRLLPGLVFGVFVAGMLWRAAMGRAPFTSVLAPVFLYYANWLVLLRGFGAVDPLGPTWSLAVEAQFYLVWPVVVWLVWRERRFRGWAWALFLGLAVAAGVVRHVGFERYPWWFLYPSTFAHIDGMILGAALAVAQRRHDLRSVLAGPLGALLGASSLVALGALARLSPSMFDPWHARYGFALASVLTALLVGHLTCSWRDPLARLLSLPPLVAIGQRSYGLYLLHYTVIQWSAPLRPVNGGGLSELQVMTIRVVVSLALAWFSFAVVEEPARRWVRRMTR